MRRIEEASRRRCCRGSSTIATATRLAGPILILEYISGSGVHALQPAHGYTDCVLPPVFWDYGLRPESGQNEAITSKGEGPIYHRLLETGSSGSPRTSSSSASSRPSGRCLHTCAMGFIWNGSCRRRPARKAARALSLESVVDGGGVRRALFSLRFSVDSPKNGFCSVFASLVYRFSARLAPTSRFHKRPIAAGGSQPVRGLQPPTKSRQAWQHWNRARDVTHAQLSSPDVVSDSARPARCEAPARPHTKASRYGMANASSSGTESFWTTPGALRGDESGRSSLDQPVDESCGATCSLSFMAVLLEERC